MDGEQQSRSQACSREPALLIWREGEVVKKQWLLDRPIITIGRAADCDVCLESRWISRNHARILREEATYRLEDAGSKNGVFVNGQRVDDARELQDGDRIQLAPGLELYFVDSEATWPLPHTVVSDLTVDQGERRVMVQGHDLLPPLSAAQYDFVALLTQEPGRVYSRAEVVRAVWPDVSPEGVSDDAVDALVRRLRQRLAEVDAQREYIVTVRGYGFKVNPELRVERQ
jgi:DNA-binding winged helix-turn-helix (wHTH) protein